MQLCCKCGRGLSLQVLWDGFSIKMGDGRHSGGRRGAGRQGRGGTAGLGGRRSGISCISECEVHLFGWGEGGRRYRVPMPESWKF